MEGITKIRSDSKKANLMKSYKKEVVETLIPVEIQHIEKRSV